MKFAFEKKLCILAVLVMLTVGAIDLYYDKLTFSNAFSLCFSAWLCVGSWHVLDYRENSPETTLEYINQLYLWPKRYLRKFMR